MQCSDCTLLPRPAMATIDPANAKRRQQVSRACVECAKRKLRCNEVRYGRCFLCLSLFTMHFAVSCCGRRSGYPLNLSLRWGASLHNVRWSCTFPSKFVPLLLAHACASCVFTTLDTLILYWCGRACDVTDRARGASNPANLNAALTWCRSAGGLVMLSMFTATQDMMDQVSHRMLQCQLCLLQQPCTSTRASVRPIVRWPLPWPIACTLRARKLP